LDETSTPTFCFVFSLCSHRLFSLSLPRVFRRCILLYRSSLFLISLFHLSFVNTRTRTCTTHMCPGAARGRRGERARGAPTRRGKQPLAIASHQWGHRRLCPIPSAFVFFIFNFKRQQQQWCSSGSASGECQEGRQHRRSCASIVRSRSRRRQH